VNYSDILLASKYKSKASDAKSRGIDFQLTFDQFRHLFNKSDGRCDYTGVSFNPTNVGKVSVERVCSSIGYVAGNVILVGEKVNQLKGCLIDIHTRKSSLTEEEDKYVGRMKAILVDEDKLKRILSKYWTEAEYRHVIATMFPNKLEQPIKEKVMPETCNVNLNAIQEPTVQTSYSISTKILNDLFVSNYYNSIANFAIKQQLPFELTLAQVKQMMLKKLCSLSKDKLLMVAEEEFQPRLIRKANDLGFVEGNVIVVSSKAKKAIEKAQETFGDELLFVGKVLNGWSELSL